jgi:2-polyprenyl-6-methoxyphenol hydroxylase-like FAD-dependent oxidoreductase
VLERDALPRNASPRPGTPQSNHPHGLLQGGLRALCTLFPGFDRELAQAGAVPLRVGLDIREELPGFDPFFPRRDQGWVSYGMSRPLIELVARRRVWQRPNVTVHEHCRVLDIIANAGGFVSAVRYRSPDDVAEVISADLVVDASARSALTLALLKDMGRARPACTRIGVDINYATTIFSIPRENRDWKVVITLPEMPESSASGYIIPIEGDRWMVLVSARHAPIRPADRNGFLELAAGLRTPTIHGAIKHATPLDKIHRFGFAENSWQHYDRLGDFPQGLLPIGDAVCHFNPIYGQGMTVAVQEACVLNDLLQRRAGNKETLAGLEQDYLAAIQPLIAAAWSQSAIPDFVHPQTRGIRPAGLDDSLRYGKALYDLAAHDPEVHKRISGVRHLIEPPATLRDPDLVRRVEAAMENA